MTMHCIACGRPYKPARLAAPHAAVPLQGGDPLWIDGTCECGSNQFQGSLLVGAASPPVNGMTDRDSEIATLKAQIDLASLCAEHSKPGGKRAVCLVCACRDLSAALSRISYLCGEPNEMECGPYDFHCDENAVVEQVRAYCEQLRADARNGD